jgi:hypothetical protein
VPKSKSKGKTKNPTNKISQYQQEYMNLPIHIIQKIEDLDKHGVTIYLNDRWLQSPIKISVGDHLNDRVMGEVTKVRVEQPIGDIFFDFIPNVIHDSKNKPRVSVKMEKARFWTYDDEQRFIEFIENYSTKR